jgi:hypothetical protein
VSVTSQTGVRRWRGLGIAAVGLAALCILAGTLLTRAHAQSVADKSIGVTRNEIRSGTAQAPARPSDPDMLKAYDVLERHCARCHQAGALARPKSAAEFGNILRLDEVAREPHLVRPGNPDASRLYTLLIGRRMPYDVHQEGSNRPAPSPDDIDLMRAWIAGLPAQSKSSCSMRPVISMDALQIAIARDLAALPPEQTARTRYLSLASVWNECGSPEYLETARRGASAFLSGQSRGMQIVQLQPVDPSGMLLRLDLEQLQWTPAEWDELTLLSPYSTATSGDDKAALHPVRLEWLAYVLLEAIRKRAEPSLPSAETNRSLPQRLTQAPTGLAKLRESDPPAFRALLAKVGLDPAPAFDQVDMIDALARRYARDTGTQRVAAELGVDPTTLDNRLEAGPPAARQLAHRLALGGLTRAALEPLFRPVSAHLEGRFPGEPRPSLGAATTARPLARSWQPAEIEIVATKPRYARGEVASVMVRSDVDCHLTLVSVSPSGRAVVLLPNDWDRSTFLPAGKEQTFPREDSPFRLRLDAAGHETIVAGCNPSAPVFDGIQHDFNLEKFTSLGDYRRFLLRLAEGMPMLTSSVPAGEKKAAPKPQVRGAGRSDAARSKSAPTARTAVRFEVR